MFLAYVSPCQLFPHVGQSVGDNLPFFSSLKNLSAGGSMSSAQLKTLYGTFCDMLGWTWAPLTSLTTCSRRTLPSVIYSDVSILIFFSSLFPISYFKTLESPTAARKAQNLTFWQVSGGRMSYQMEMDSFHRWFGWLHRPYVQKSFYLFVFFYPFSMTVS